jgi:hypothetical protein
VVSSPNFSSTSTLFRFFGFLSPLNKSGLTMILVAVVDVNLEGSSELQII